MNVVGAFRELEMGRGDLLPSITESPKSLDIELAISIAEYLERGVVIADYMEATPDPFDKNIRLPGAPSLMTDGIWVWRMDTAYYEGNIRLNFPTISSHLFKMMY